MRILFFVILGLAVGVIADTLFFLGGGIATLCGAGTALILWILSDVTQKEHTIVRNFPIVGNFRYWLEAIGPEIRQYLVNNNDVERPFSRDQRRWVYASSKRQNNYAGFGSDNNFDEAENYLIIRQSPFPVEEPHEGDANYDPNYTIPCAKIMGQWRKRPKAFRPSSIVNVSAMSFGSLSQNAVMALNAGVKLAGAMQCTGEGGLSPYHKQGGDLIWQLGTSYFGCRTPEGRFDMSRFKDVVASNPVRCIEVKISQGAKPGKGGILPGSKVTPEIAAIRGIPMGKDCISPSGHPEFHDVDGMLDFVEKLSEASGLPVGIKAAVGQMSFWHDLATQMKKGDRGVDFITVDGGEGGTGAAPFVFADHVALPFRQAFTQVYSVFAKKGLHEKIVFIGSGRLGFPEQVIMSMMLGCDMISVAREAMLAIGCIQAQRCHTGGCPTGIATQNKWLMRGLNPKLKAVRMGNYLVTLRKEVLQLTRACGAIHPSMLPEESVEVLLNAAASTGINLKSLFNYKAAWGHPSKTDQVEMSEVMHQISPIALRSRAK